MSQPSERPAEWHPSEGDFFKAQFDYLKHLSTLATGSILLLSLFLEKFFKQPTLAWCVTLSVSALFVSLLASTVVYTVAVLNYPRPGRRMSSRELDVIAGGTLVTWVGFLVGIGAIAVFFVANWK